jgi:hypothetical protein
MTGPSGHQKHLDVRTFWMTELCGTTKISACQKYLAWPKCLHDRNIWMSETSEESTRLKASVKLQVSTDVRKRVPINVVVGFQPDAPPASLTPEEASGASTALTTTPKPAQKRRAKKEVEKKSKEESPSKKRPISAGRLSAIFLRNVFLLVSLIFARALEVLYP